MGSINDMTNNLTFLMMFCLPSGLIIMTSSALINRLAISIPFPPYALQAECNCKI